MIKICFLTVIFLALVPAYSLPKPALFDSAWFHYSFSKPSEMNSLTDDSDLQILIHPAIVNGALYLCSEPNKESSVIVERGQHKNMTIAYRFKYIDSGKGSVSCTLQVKEDKPRKTGISLMISKSSDDGQTQVRFVNRKNGRVMKQRQINEKLENWQQAVFVFQNGRVQFFLNNSLVLQAKGAQGYPGTVSFSAQNGAELWVDDIDATHRD
jgi:hypothetical protein